MIIFSLFSIKSIEEIIIIMLCEKYAGEQQKLFVKYFFADSKLFIQNILNSNKHLYSIET
jgi:hypothetical protein